MKKNYLVLSTGFALFSMFFGSGNLVFPLAVGQESGTHFLFAALGILITGVLVPFLGVFGMMLYQGNSREFFNSLGNRGTFYFSLFALSIMGPFGVLARCLTVMHGSVALLFPQVSLPMFSLTMCLIIYFLTINKNRILGILGTFLTPFLLLSLFAIAFLGLKDGLLPQETYQASWAAFKNGFFQGYQTMDLLAAFFFSTFVLTQLQKESSINQSSALSIKLFCQSALIGATLLSLIYLGLVWLGALHSTSLIGIAPQEMLATIALKVLGPFGAPGVCLIVVFACLTTATVLASLYADFLQKEVTYDKISYKQALLITLAIGFLISTLEFAGIAKFLVPVLEAIYPALIVLTVINICQKLWSFQTSHWPVTLTLIAKLCFF